jgi:hypothetical protein
MSASERRATRQAWKGLTKDDRLLVLELARFGEQHGDPVLRRVAAGWSAAWLDEFSVLRLLGLLVIGTCSVAFSSIVLSVPLVLGVAAEAVVVVLLATTYRGASRVDRTYNTDR